MERSQVVVVTGASAGIGRATVQAFACEGASIGLLARGRDRLEQTREEVERLGGRALAIPTDVAFADQVEAAAQRIEGELGPIDVWINSAMTSVFAEFRDIEPHEYRRVTDVTYHGTAYGTRAALRRMLPRDRGTIVLVGSALAYRGIPLQSAYCGAKHAIQGMFESVRTELLHNGSNVRITMVQLPAHNTPQFNWVRSKLAKRPQPVPPIYQPETAARAILWAARHPSREIYLGAPSVKAIVGNKIAPGHVDRLLARSGYRSQLRDEAEDPHRPDNLFEPVAGNYAAHGDFDSRSRDTAWSPQIWATENGRWLALAGLGVAGILASFWAGRE